MPRVQATTDSGARILRYANGPRHYLTSEGSAMLAESVQAAADDPEIRCIILTGTDDVFIRHYDVSELVTLAGAVQSGQMGEADFKGGPFNDLMDAITQAPKPVIAAINGVCMGGGFELSLACDLRIAGSGVMQIGLPETRIGIFPGGGGTQRLPRLIGEAAALEFILTGQIVDAETAYEFGLVNGVADDPLEAAMIYARGFAARGAEGIAMAKALVRGAFGRTMDEGRRAEQRAFFEVLKTDSAMYGMTKFLSNGEDITQ